MITFGIAIYSILFTVISLRTSNRIFKFLFIGLALCSEAIYPVITEYFIGLEGLRLAIIWYLSEDKKSKITRVKKTLLSYLPYMVIMLGFLYWRLIIFNSDRPTTDLNQLLDFYQTGSWNLVSSIPLEFLRDLLNSIIFAWFVPAYTYFTNVLTTDGALSIILALIISALVVVYINWMDSRDHGLEQDPPENNYFKTIFWIGLFATIISMIPFVVSNRQISFSYGQTTDRYTLVTIMGVILLILGLIFLITKKKGRIILVSVLVFLAILTHYSNMAFFRNGWEDQRQIWWQLAWRAPQLKEGTVLMLNPPYATHYFFGEDYITWAPADMLYNNVPNTLKIFAQVINTDTINDLRQDVPVKRLFRFIYLEFDYSNTLVISMQDSNTSCLHVLDSKTQELSVNEPPLVAIAGQYSNIDQIDLTGTESKPPEIIFGKEPEHGWCYYYQKMSLARQRMDWKQVVTLGEKAITSQLAPMDISEWMPLIEGYAYTNQFELANRYIDLARQDRNVIYNICHSILVQLSTMKSELPEEGYEFLYKAFCTHD